MVYGVVVVISLFAMKYGSRDYNVLRHIVFCLGLGGLCHIVQDALSGKVQLMKPFRKDFSIRLIKTGSIIETIIITLISGVLLYYAKDRLINSLSKLVNW